jgi:3-deoxy-D-manno-octulosonate 8-phosphate phosphatase KdsC-like HAD superfamily phosphatase
MELEPHIAERARRIELLIMDRDGDLTDGLFIFGQPA